MCVVTQDKSTRIYMFNMYIALDPDSDCSEEGGSPLPQARSQILKGGSKYYICARLRSRNFRNHAHKFKVINAVIVYLTRCIR